MPRFVVGDNVWYAKCRWEQIRVVCPTCFGKRSVTLILGNGERVLLPCTGCASTGYIQEYQHVAEAELITIAGMSIEITGDKEKVRYLSGNYSYDDTDFFPTQEEARTRAEAKRESFDNEQRTRAEHIKKNVHKSFAWNAHYHMMEARRLRKEAAYHDESARLCEER